MKAGILFLLLLSFLSLSVVYAAPSGGLITSATTETGPNTTAGSRTDDRGTITTLTLDTIQQDQHWKAYVGNVSGTLTLDDADNWTIYDWDLTTISGQVYASRFNNVTWTGVSCATPNDINAEADFHNMSDSDSDDLNNTFNWSIHKTFEIATTTIGQNTCNSTVTYVNDSRRVPTTSSTFQEILIKDVNGQFVLLASIDDDSIGFDGNSTNGRTYDFQMIVPESDVKSTATTYYFYVELR